MNFKKSDILIVVECLLSIYALKSYFSKSMLDEQLVQAFQDLEAAELSVLNKEIKKKSV